MAYFITEVCDGCEACVKLCPTRAISGEKKQRHSIDPEYCVECGTCGRVCPEEAIQDPSGNRCKPVKRTEWQKPKVVGKRCVSCSLCVEACPFGCLELQVTADSYENRPLPVLIKPKACVACSQCVKACPLDYLELA